MTPPKTYRIGIDVGGTFTKAVLIDNQTFEVVERYSVLTTHSDARGVAKGEAAVQLQAVGGPGDGAAGHAHTGSSGAGRAMFRGMFHERVQSPDSSDHSTPQGCTSSAAASRG